MNPGAARPVLLAEDNAVNQRVVTAMLERLGFQVDVVGGGVHAVDKASVVTYEVILMDCQLPQMDGFQAATEIRRWRGASRNAPIIAITSANRDADHQRCLAAGMDDYLSKPISLQGLAEVLARWAPEASAHLTINAEPDLDPRDHVLDAQIVERLERLGAAAGEDLMGQLTVLYLADSDDRLAELKSALAAHDASAIYSTAHALTGASANIGATRLAHLCTALAITGKAGDLGDIETLVEAVEAELVRVRSALESRSVTA